MVDNFYCSIPEEHISEVIRIYGKIKQKIFIKKISNEGAEWFVLEDNIFMNNVGTKYWIDHPLILCKRLPVPSGERQGFPFYTWYIHRSIKETLDEHFNELGKILRACKQIPENCLQVPEDGNEK